MWLELLVKYLVTANTTLPVIVETVDSVVETVKAVTGSGPSVRERAEMIRAQVAENDNYGKQEIRILEAKIAADQQA